MRSINTLEWHAGQEVVSLKAVALKSTMFAKSIKLVLRVLFYVPYQFNQFLDKLDASPDDYRRQVMHNTRQGLQSGRYRHIPPRVWQRRSALLTLLEQNTRTTLTATNGRDKNAD